MYQQDIGQSSYKPMQIQWCCVAVTKVLTSIP